MRHGILLQVLYFLRRGISAQAQDSQQCTRESPFPSLRLLACRNQKRLLIIATWEINPRPKCLRAQSQVPTRNSHLSGGFWISVSLHWLTHRSARGTRLSYFCNTVFICGGSANVQNEIAGSDDSVHTRLGRVLGVLRRIHSSAVTKRSRKKARKARVFAGIKRWGVSATTGRSGGFHGFKIGTTRPASRSDRTI